MERDVACAAFNMKCALSALHVGCDRTRGIWRYFSKEGGIPSRYGGLPVSSVPANPGSGARHQGELQVFLEGPSSDIDRDA